METGYICGSMLAENVPRAKAPVITFWEVRSPSLLMTPTCAAVFAAFQPAPLKCASQLLAQRKGAPPGTVNALLPAEAAPTVIHHCSLPVAALKQTCPAATQVASVGYCLRLPRLQGDIIDNMNSSFITSKWSVQHSVDLQHWRKFEPFRPLEQQVKATGGRWVQDLHPFKAHSRLPVLFLVQP